MLMTRRERVKSVAPNPWPCFVTTGARPEPHAMEWGNNVAAMLPAARPELLETPTAAKGSRED